MQINKERSKKIRKLLTFTLAANIMLSGGIGAKAEQNDEIDEYIKKQIDYHNAKYELEMKMTNLSQELYDKEYNDFCENGTIVINNHEYFVKDLYIEYGYIGDKKTVYLIDYKNPKADIITDILEPDKNYVRRKIILLKYSDVFYAYFHNKDKSLEEYISLFEGNINYNVPETYFYNPIFNSDVSKEKVR